MVSGRGRTQVRALGGPMVEAGPHGLAILAAFSAPASVQSALDELTRRARSKSAVVEMMARIVDLKQAGLLRPAGASGPQDATGFAGAPIHIAMLNDRTRTSAFLDAITKTVRPDDVVVDLGTGTGVLAIAAARAGAQRVYAIESSAIADTAEAMFIANGVSDRVTLVRGWSTSVELSERADVLVTETLGGHPWEEGWPALVRDARERWLKPNGRVIPSEVRWVAQPVSLPASTQRRMAFADIDGDNWAAWYDMDFSALVNARARSRDVAFVRPSAAREWVSPCEPVVLATARADGSGSTEPGIWRETNATQRGVIDGVLLSWEATLCPGVELTTAPGHAGSDCSWQVLAVQAAESRDVLAGDRVGISVVQGRPLAVRLLVNPEQDTKR